MIDYEVLEDVFFDWFSNASEDEIEEYFFDLD